MGGESVADFPTLLSDKLLAEVSPLNSFWPLVERIIFIRKLDFAFLRKRTGRCHISFLPCCVLFLMLQPIITTGATSQIR